MATEKVRMLTSMAGPKVSYRYGQVLEVGVQLSAEEAARWIAHGVCESVGGPPALPHTPQNAIETAHIEPTEEVAAVVRRPRGRPRKAGN